MREVAAEFERPVLLFSGGKDSIVLLRLAEKAFRPGAFPCPILHIDTGHNFPEVLEFRDRRVAELGEQLIVASVQDSIDAGPRARGRPVAQPAADGDAARRARASIASTPRSAARGATRSARGPRSGCCRSATSSASGSRATSARRSGTCSTPSCGAARACARSRSPTGPSSTSGATSSAEELEVPSIYYAHEREVFERDGMLFAVSECSPPPTARRSSTRARALPHGGRPDGDRRRALGRRRHRRGDRRDRRLARRPSAARPAPTTARPRPPWRTASARATSRCRTCCASPPRARSTTASRR